MFKLIVPSIAVVALVGCAGQTRMPALSAYDAKFAPYSSSEAVNAVQFHRDGRGGDIPACVAETVSNQGETLADSSGSFVGAYTGTYYNIQRSSQSSGGSVIEYVAPDGKSVVASGSTRYSAGALVVRSVRFKLSVKQSGAGRTYRYSNLGQAQLDTGAAANNGYAPIGSWSGANPDIALASLSNITDQIERCLSR